MNSYRVRMSSSDRAAFAWADIILDETVDIRTSQNGEVFAFMAALRRADEMLTPEQRSKVRSVECWYVAPCDRAQSRGRGSIKQRALRPQESNTTSRGDPSDQM